MTMQTNETNSPASQRTQQQTKQRSGLWIIFAIIWNLGWIGGGVFFALHPSNLLISHGMTDIFKSLNPELILMSMLLGGVGGACGSFYGLYQQARQGFADPGWTLVFLVKPFLGAIASISVYILLLLGVMAFPASIVSYGPIFRWTIIVLAFIAGFFEQGIFWSVEAVSHRIEKSPPGRWIWGRHSNYNHHRK